MREMLERLAESGPCGFDELFAGATSRQEIIVTFLATLELIRTKLIRVLQTRVCGPIRIHLGERPAAAPAAAAPGDGIPGGDGGEEPG